MVHILQCWFIRQIEEGAGICSTKFSRSRKYETFTFAKGEDREDPDVLLQKFAELCLPTKNIIMDRQVFNTTNQKPGESTQSYVSTLKILAEKKCDFGILNDELIHNSIVCGI